MASASFVVNNDAAAAVTFTLQSQDLRSAIYIDKTSSLSAPRAAMIKHDLKPTGAKGTDRHDVKFSTGVVDADGVVFNPAININITVPRSAAVTDAVMYDLRALAVNYLTKARLDDIIDGVTP